MGEGTHSQVWANRTGTYKVPKRGSVAAVHVFRDAFFRQLNENFYSTLVVGNLHDRRVPVLCDQLLTTVSVSEQNSFNPEDVINDLTCDVYKITQNGLRHGDITPLNVCKTYYDRLKLVDYGNAADIFMARVFKHPHLPSFECRAPEVKQPSDISNASEIWSLGATVASLCLGRYMLVNNPTQRRCNLVIREAWNKNKRLGAFLRLTLQVDPSKRANIEFLATEFGCRASVRPRAYIEKSIDWFEISKAAYAIINGRLQDGVVLNDDVMHSMIKCVDDAKSVRKMFL